MAKTVIGIFKNHQAVDSAISELKELGYDSKSLSIIMKDYKEVHNGKSKMVGGAVSGVAASTATGATTGAIAGGPLGSLISLGIPEKDAKVYEEYIRAGGILLAVGTREREESQVHKLLEDAGAVDIKALNLPRGAIDSDYEKREEIIDKDVLKRSISYNF